MEGRSCSKHVSHVSESIFLLTKKTWIFFFEKITILVVSTFIMGRYKAPSKDFFLLRFIVEKCIFSEIQAENTLAEPIAASTLMFTWSSWPTSSCSAVGKRAPGRRFVARRCSWVFAAILKEVSSDLVRVVSMFYDHFFR